MLPIPLIDLQCLTDSNNISESELRELGKDVVTALGKWGFAYLDNHGVSENKITNAFSASKHFFTLPKSTKLSYGKKDRISHGYYESLDHYEKKYTCREIFDIFDISQNGKYPNVEVPDFKSSLLSLKFDLDKLGCLILQLIAAGLELDDINYFVKQHNGIRNDEETIENCTQTNLRTMYYPILSNEAMELIENVGKGELLNEHTDYGTITILLQDYSVGGLEVLQGRTWVPIPPREGSIILNTGDLMEIWTSGLIPATIHRVITTTSDTTKAKPRQSIPYFINPDNEVVVQPILLNGTTNKSNGKIYSSVVAKDYCQNRLGYSYT